MTADPVAAIPETDAHGEIAEVYEDIRRTLGVAVVNLVWRHLATIDGALPWAWSAVRPAYINGAVSGRAVALKQALAPPRLVGLERDVLSAAGVGQDELPRIMTIQTSYDRSNAMNYLALAALVGHGGAAPDQPHTASPAASPAGPRAGDAAPLGELPTLPPLDSNDAQLAALLTRLNRLAQTREDAIMVTMYRHLSYWPGYLALLWALLAPLAADGRLQSAVTAAEATARPHVGQLTRELGAANDHAAGKTALADFLARVELPKMIVITRMLNAAMPA